METLEQPIFPLFLDELPWSRPVSPANQQALLASAEAAKMTVGSGRQCSMLLNVSDPLGAFSKILLESSLWTSSEEFCYVWNRLDTQFECSAFQLTPLGQSTDDNGSSLWRTPNGTEDNGGGDNGKRRLEQGHALRLRGQVKTPSLWPTPRAEGSESGMHKENHPGNPRLKPDSLGAAAKLWPTPSASQESGMDAAGRIATGHQVDLSSLARSPKLWPTPRKEGYDAQGKDHGDLVYEVKNRLLPTPTVQDGANNAGPSQMERNSLSLNATFGGSLNPRFVEELMGYEIDHTACGHSVTPSCPSKPTRSSKRSRRSEVF